MKNALAVTTAIASLVSIGDKVGRAHGYVAKLAALGAVAGLVLPLAGVDFKAALTEYKAATPEQKQVLNASFDTKLVLVDEKLEAKIEKAIDLLAKGRMIFDEGKEFIKEIQDIFHKEAA